VNLFQQIGYTYRMVSGLDQLLRTPPHADPDRVIRRQLENREECFLDLARRVVFANPANPYYRMFQLAGCSHEDLAGLVRRRGLEPALAELHGQGVWLAHDEFKRHQPIVRSGQEIPSDAASFRNPLSRGGIESRSGGSRSAGTRFVRSVPARLHAECYMALVFREHGVSALHHLVVKPVLPATDGVMESCVQHARLGLPAEHWFALAGASMDSVHYRLATNAMLSVARLRGLSVPYPDYISGNDFSPVAKWIANRRREGKATAVFTHVSPAVRVASAAAEMNLDIQGTQFFAGGETLTEAKRRVIEASGAAVFPRYVVSEIGAIGFACRQMREGDCVHLLHGSVAVISHTRLAPLSQEAVPSLLFTNLLPYAPFVLINVEMEDSGVLGEATCNCAFRAVGLDRRVDNIFSYGKLTGQGVTLVGTDVVRILEEVLPKRFGGCATDYQLVEQDGSRQAMLTLRVSRRVALDSTEDVREYFFQQLRRLPEGASASRVWRDTHAVTVVHEDPIVTARGKVLPLHLLGSGGRSGGAHGS
jgi:hypothetical protein